MSKKQPLLFAAMELYINGGTNIVGLVDATLPPIEARTESIEGAGIGGEVEVPVKGQYSSMGLTLNFRAIYDPAVLALPVAGDSVRFDLRTALETQNVTDGTRGVSSERVSITGPIKTINPGTRKGGSAGDASIEASVYHFIHFIDGRNVREIGAFTGVDTVNGVDQRAGIRAAIS